jgi:hypothetical protein
MEKKVILLTIFIVAVLLTGCTQQGGTTGKTFIGGNEGLRTTFLSGTPPDKITDGGSGTFSIIIKTENTGEGDIAQGDGYVQIWGLDAAAYGASQYADFKLSFPEAIRGSVRGFDGGIVSGGVSTIGFESLSYAPSVVGDWSQTIYANICYRYSTRVASQICIKNDVEQALGDTKICEVEGEKNPQNSGGPIQVTSMKESYGGNGKMVLTLTITHTGNGDSFFAYDDLNCNNVATNNNRGKVKVEFEDVQLGGRTIPVVCPSIATDGYVRLFSDNGQKETQTVYCTVDVSGVTNIVQVPINLKLSYVYLQHIDKEMIIRHVLT